MAIVGDAYVVVHAITTGVERDISKAMNNISTSAANAGKSINKSFTSAASGGLTKAEQEAVRTYKAINALIERSYYLQGAIAGLVPILGVLVGGLFALGSQVAAATPALIVLPSIFTAMGQAMLSVKLAMSGVTKAIGQLGKQKKTSGIDNMPSLLEAYAAAQERVYAADKRLTRALKDLDQAQKNARESLQQLNFEAEDAAISEQRAAMAFEEARRNLLMVQDMPVGSAVRREAELAFAEADLNLRRAIDRNADLAEETARRNAAGVEGSDEVISAQEAVTEAQKEQQKALIALAKATENLNKKQGGGGGAGGADPLEGLSQSAKEFAKFIYSLKPRLDELKAAAGEGLFGPLTKAIKLLVGGGFFTTLKKLVADTGEAAGNAALDFSKIVSESRNLKNLNTVGKTNTDTISKLGKVVGNLYSSFLSLLAAADPLIRRFTDWTVTLTESWKNSELLENRSGRLTNAFNAAGDVAAQLGRIIKNLGGAFFEMGKAAAGPGSGGQLILDYFENATKKFKDFATTANNDGSLEQYFLRVSENFTKIMDILGIISGALMRTGDDEGTATFLDSIANAAEILGNALNKLTEGGAGGAFGKFIEQMATFIAQTSEAGSLKVYFGILTKALELLNKILSNPIAQKIFLIAATVHGGRLAFSRLGTVVKKTTEYLHGNFLSIRDTINSFKTFTSTFKNGFSAMLTSGGTFFASLKAGFTSAIANTKLYAVYQKVAAGATKIWTGIQAAFNAVMALNPIGLLIIGIGLLIGGIVVAYKKFEWFRNGIKKVFRGIMSVIEGPINFFIDGINLLIRGLNAINPFSDIPYIPKLGGNKDFPEEGATGNETSRFEAKSGVYKMAAGGIVRPRTGGTLAVIGEAGRAERVEPLDKDGLSKRDRAIIAMLSGGGATFNIYPSPGMNEVELAAMVSRQVTRTLKKGGF